MKRASIIIFLVYAAFVTVDAGTIKRIKLQAAEKNLISASISYHAIQKGNDQNTFLFTTPVLYQPIISLGKAQQKNTDAQSFPKKLPELKVTLVKSQFTPNTDDKKNYDQFLSIEYLEINNELFHVFIKEGVIQRICIIQKTTGKEICFDRSVPAFSKNNEDLEYFQESEKIIKTILAGEDFLQRLSSGKNVLTANLTIDQDIVVGVITFSTIELQERFSIYMNQLENCAFLSFKDSKPRIHFSVTARKNEITLANVYDNNIQNGFDCAFYPNHGLKYFLPLINGKFDKITTWQMGGKGKKVQPLDEWMKEQK